MELIRKYVVVPKVFNVSNKAVSKECPGIGSILPPEILVRVVKT